MARAYESPLAVLPLLLAAANGALAGLVALGGLAAFASLQGGSPWVPANALGAWLVRWLQNADPSATVGFYYDATLGGIMLAAGGGAVGGLVWWALLVRWRGLSPLVAALLVAVLRFAAVRWIVAPVLNPLLVSDLPGLARWSGAAQAGPSAGVWSSLAALLLPAAPWWAATIAYGVVLGLGLQLEPGRASSRQHRSNGAPRSS